MLELWHHTSIYSSCLASMQWYGGTFDKDHQTWTHSYGCYQHTRLEFTLTKDILWISCGIQANTKYSPFMVLTGHMPRFTIDNNLRGLCDVFDE